MNKEEFKSCIRGKTVLADFSADWCGPCRAMEPIIKDIADKYKGRATLMEINIDFQKNLAMDFMVQSIPTLIIFKDGREMKRMVGMQSKTAIEQNLNAVLKALSDP